MYLENITKELENHGINAEEVTVMKNGVPCTGIRVVTGTDISPVVYYAQGETIEEFVSRIQDAIEHTPAVDAGMLSDREYILKNLYVTVQRYFHDDSIIGKNVLNVEAMLRIFFNVKENEECGSVKVTKEILNFAGMSQDEAWEAAIDNTRSTLHVYSMAEALGLDETDAGWLQVPLDVATTERRSDGAAALLFPDLFRDYCTQRNIQSCILLPSSTQEILILPEDGDDTRCDYHEMACMVRDINNTQLDPTIQLAPVVYRYDLKSDAIRIVAEVCEGEGD